MTRTILLAAAALVVLGGAAGYLGLAGSADENVEAASVAATGSAAPAPGAMALPTFEVPWEGFYRVGAADRFAHTYETEPLVAPLARAGFKVEVPEGVADLAFRLEWQGDAELHMMVHAPMDEKHVMGSYMTPMMNAPSPHCVRLPAEDLEAGTWEAMAHTMNAAENTVFTITVIASAPTEPTVLDDLHGHPMNEDWSMDMREYHECE